MDPEFLSSVSQYEHVVFSDVRVGISIPEATVFLDALTITVVSTFVSVPNFLGTVLRLQRNLYGHKRTPVLLCGLLTAYIDVRVARPNNHCA